MLSGCQTMLPRILCRVTSLHTTDTIPILSLLAAFLYRLSRSRLLTKGNIFQRSSQQHREGSRCSMEISAFAANRQRPQLGGSANALCLPLRCGSTVSFENKKKKIQGTIFSISANEPGCCALFYFNGRGVMKEKRVEWMRQLGRRSVLSNSQG